MMGQIRHLFVFIALVSAALPHGDTNIQKVFEEYSKAKVMESCFGEKISRLYAERIVNAVRTCSTIKPPAVGDKHVPETQAPQSPSSGPHKRPPIHMPPRKEDVGNMKQAQDANPSLFDNRFDWQDLFQYSKYGSLIGNKIIPVPYSVDSHFFDDFHFFRRSKRQIQDFLFNEEAIRQLKNRVVSSLSNVTCVFERMNYINEKKQLKFDSMVEEVKRLNLNPELEKDLIYGLEHCRDTTTCLPVERMRTVVPPNLKRVLHFMKCVEEQRYMACMKNDLRRQRNKFDLRGLDGILENLEEDDQILAVVWSSTVLNSAQKNILDIVF